jgi:hypothetical protein
MFGQRAGYFGGAWTVSRPNSDSKVRPAGRTVKPISRSSLPTTRSAMLPPPSSRGSVAPARSNIAPWRHLMMTTSEAEQRGKKDESA